ncbi:MAG: type I-MYXAN CRISPR-associated protein Cas6/Cmx6, partial [Burkholderiales bacterium]
RLDDAFALAGRSLRLGAQTLQVGAGKPWPLTPSNTVYARLVIAGPEDEARFAQALGGLLRSFDAACQVVLGKPRTLATRAGSRQGFSVLLHGMTPEQSLRLQERGLGELRLHGCGIVVPYKSIAAV